MIDDLLKNPTFEDTSPLFKSWNTWYLLVIIMNIISIGLVALMFSLI